MYIIKVITVNW